MTTMLKSQRMIFGGVVLTTITISFMVFAVQHSSQSTKFKEPTLKNIGLPLEALDQRYRPMTVIKNSRDRSEIPNDRIDTDVTKTFDTVQDGFGFVPSHDSAHTLNLAAVAGAFPINPVGLAPGPTGDIVSDDTGVLQMDSRKLFKKSLIGDETRELVLHMRREVGLSKDSKSDFHALPRQSQAEAHNAPLSRAKSDSSKLPASVIDSSLLGCPSEYAISSSDDVWFRSNIVQRSPNMSSIGSGSSHTGRYDNRNDTQQLIVILTPVSNVKRHLEIYFKNLCSLEYPHQLISVVLGEDSSSDGTFEEAKKHADILRPYFRNVEVVKLKGSGEGVGGQARHEPYYQYRRRRHLALARNKLLFAGLKPTDQWVVWMDSDVKHIPRDLIERLLAVKKDVVVPNCLYKRADGQTETFDRNTWRETGESLKYLKDTPPDFLMLEGYGNTLRLYLNDLKTEGDIVHIDGVGGCVLLINADRHRSGLIFPPFTFKHHIETEGLAKLAANMNIDIYGLPSLNIIHM